MAKRNYPNDYYCWYNDDTRIAILEKKTTSDNSVVHKELWDTFQSDGDLSGNITATSTATGEFADITSTAHNLEVNDRVEISGTTNYNGNHTVTVVGDAITFRIAVTNSEADEGASSGVTWKSLFVNDGLRVSGNNRYAHTDSATDTLRAALGLDLGLHHYLVCYVKARLYEDAGELQQAMYFRKMFEEGMKKFPHRKSGLRRLSVPHL